LALYSDSETDCESLFNDSQGRTEIGKGYLLYGKGNVMAIGMENFLRAIFSLVSAATFLSGMISFYSHSVTYALWPYVGPDEFKELHRRYTAKLALLVSVSHGFWAGCGLLLVLVPSDRFCFLDGALNVTIALLVIGLSLFVAAPLHAALGRTGIKGNPAYGRLMIVSRVRVMLGMLAGLGQCAAIYLKCMPG
jgi:hypothetical protein